jgi:hypothetical protein
MYSLFYFSLHQQILLLRQQVHHHIMLNLEAELQVLKQVEEFQHQVTKVNTAVLVFQASNPLKAVLVLVFPHRYMNQVDLHHKVVLHLVVMQVHRIMKVTVVQMVIISI